MPQKSQNRAPVNQTHQLSSAYSHTVAMQNDDDDDICPVCESECTCNSRASIPPPPTNQQPTQSLKIRLTVPPKFLSTLNQAKLQENQKLTTSAVAHDGGPPATPSSIPKKRGRPTKAEAEAKRLAALRAAELDAQQQRLNRARATRPAAPSNKSSHKKRQQTKALGRKTKKHVYPTSSTESESEERVGTFPTFTSPFAVSKAAGLIESDSSSLSSLPDPGDETSLEVEEERYVIEQHEESARMRRERLGDEAEPRRNSRHSWEASPQARNAAVGVVDGTTEDSDTSESDSDEEEEEEDGDADEEADGECEMDEDAEEEMFATRAFLYESDDDEIDADIFFASLSDSETSVAGFDHVFEAPMEDDDDSSDTPMEAVHPRERADPMDFFGPLSKFNSTTDIATIFVSKELDGMASFADGNDLAMGMLDIDFELSVVAQQQQPMSTPMFPMQRGVEEDEEMWIPTDEEDEQSDCGDTTDEDLISMRGIQTASGIVLFRVPTPPVSSIDPLFTLSPVTRRKSSSTKKHKRFSRSKKNTTLAPKPHDILNKSSSGVAQIPEMNESGTADDTGSVDGASSISWVLRQPSMGHFEKSDPTRQHIIINGEPNTNIPSPVVKTARIRRGSGSSRGRKRSIIRDGSPFSLTSRGQARSPMSSRSRSTEASNRNQSGRETPDFVVPLRSIELADVLDTTFLDGLTTETEGEQSGADGGKYIGRWDRVPMGTFRRTRTAAGLSAHLEPVLEWAPNQAPAVSDGFCYGSPGGSLMRSGPLFPSAPESGWLDAPTASPLRMRNENNGDRTPTPSGVDPYSFAFGNTPPESQERILSHKDRRKEKRRHQLAHSP